MDTNNFISVVRERLKTKSNFDFYGAESYDGIHIGKLYFNLFGEFYSKYTIRNAVRIKDLSEALIVRFELKKCQIIRTEFTIHGSFNRIDNRNLETILILKEGLIVGLESFYINILYGPDITKDEIDEIIEVVKEYGIEDKSLRKFYMIQYRGAFELSEFEIKPFETDLESHYNDDFTSVNKLISESLNTPGKNGLVLLHGKYGSGKTSYLRYLISNIDRKFIYFPQHLTEMLNSPEFLPFISSVQDSILILEDCESLLEPRDNGATKSSALSNLLNLGDGLLADALSLNVICTFNANLRKIDEAILRKGRLIAKYEFKELEVMKARKLAETIGKKITIDKPMTLTEIYNVDELNFENTPIKSMGFKAAV